MLFWTTDAEPWSESAEPGAFSSRGGQSNSFGRGQVRIPNLLDFAFSRKYPSRPVFKSCPRRTADLHYRQPC